MEFSILFVVLPIAKANEPPTDTLETTLSSIVSKRVGWFLIFESPTPISPFWFDPQTTILCYWSMIAMKVPPIWTLLTRISLCSLTFRGLLNSPKMPEPHTYITPCSVIAALECHAEIYLK